MSIPRQLCFAYQVQIRETEDTNWEDLDIMVSLPGHAPKRVCDSVKAGSQNLVRVMRINESEVFRAALSRGVAIATQVGQEHTPIDFTDCTMEPLQ